MTSRSALEVLARATGGDVLEGLLARDRAAVLLLPERVAAARVVLAVVRVAPVALGVLDDLALAARRGAGGERLAVDPQVAALLVGEPGDDLAGEAVDLAAEVLGLLLAALDAVEALLPAAGQLRAREHVVAEHLHEPDALLGGPQAAALALDVLRVDQPLDGGGPGRRRADAGVLHRLGGLVVVHDELAGGLHGAQQRALRVARRRLGPLGERLGLGAAHLLAHGQGRQGLLGLLVVLLGAGARRPPPRRRPRATPPRSAPCRGCGRGARPTRVSTTVRSKRAAGWKTARNRRATMS